MPFTVTMPKLSPTMEEGVIVKWYKTKGDKVKVGEVLIEVATDKATVEYNALDEGFLREILIPVNGQAIVNQPIAIFTETADERIEGYEPEGSFPKKEESQLTDQKSDKEDQKTQSVSTPIGAVCEQPVFTPEPPLENYEFGFPTKTIKRIAASPLARKLSKEKGLDLTTVKGTGPKGRVISRDLQFAQPALSATFGKRSLPNEIPGSFEEKELTPMRRVIAQRLQQAKSLIPHVYIRQTVDAKPLFEAREQLKKGELKITFNDLIIRASALALKEHPEINSGFDSEKQAIILFKTIDIAVAVTITGGLITPIIRHADYKNLGEISVEIKELVARARDSKLQPEEYKGGSFTISNMGMFNVSEFAAIINPPQAAILAIGGIQEISIVKDGELAIGKSLNLTLSVDHRVIDGVEGVKFIKTVQKYLENPSLLLV